MMQNIQNSPFTPFITPETINIGFAITCPRFFKLNFHPYKISDFPYSIILLILSKIIFSG